MAHFFDPKNGRPLSTLTVAKQGNFQLALYGGGPNGEDLVVTTDPASTSAEGALVADKDIGNHTRLLTLNAALLRSQKIYALFNGGSYSEPVEVQFSAAGAGGAQFGKADIRKSIVTLARSFVASGHYLWGTAGNTPGSSDGNPGGSKASIGTLRAASLDQKEMQNRDKVIAVSMAVQSLADGYNTCAGRSRGKIADLNQYLTKATEAQSKNPDQTTWPGVGPFNLHPRRFHFRGAPGAAGAIVWGEACHNRKHFDCVGLVNYCYAYHFYKKNFALEIYQWAGGAKGSDGKVTLSNAGIGGTVTIKNDKDVMDADVIVKPDYGHIAMVYLEGGKAKVVQAEETEVGLTENADLTSFTGWTRVRMLDAYLVPMKANLQ